MHRFGFFALTLCMLAGCVVTPPPSEPAVTPSSVRRPAGATESRIFDLINAERRRQGLSALTYNPQLDRMAKIQAQNMAHVKRTMQSLTAEHTGQSVETIERDADRDAWFTAEEALAYGFIDRVVEHLDDVRPDASMRRAGL